MGKYRKKPVEIDAMEWTGTNCIEMDDFCGGLENTYHKAGKFIIKTLEGEMTANKGDFIIKGIGGEFYPCKPDIFAATYEEALTPLISD